MSKLNKSPILNIDEMYVKLFSAFPQLKMTIEYSHNEKGKIGRIQCENPNQPSYPLIITIYDYDGIYVDFSGVTLVEFENDVTEELIQQIELLIDNKVVVLAAYNNEGVLFFTAMFTDDEEENSISEYEKYKAKLSEPIPKWKRPFTLYKGTFVFNNWSGSKYLKIER